MLLIHHPIQDQSFPQRSISSLGVHVVDEVDDSVGVSILVVVPGDQLDKGSWQLNPSLGVEDWRSVVSQEVSGHNHVLSVAKNSWNNIVIQLILYLTSHPSLMSRKPPSAWRRSQRRWPPSPASQSGPPRSRQGWALWSSVSQSEMSKILFQPIRRGKYTCTS